MVRRLLVVLGVACVAASPVPAEAKTTVELALLDTLTRLDDWEAGFAAAALGRVFLDAAPTESLRGQLALEARVGDTTELAVSRAYVRVRTPAWRTTHGLAPLSWGQGFFYNAADVVFGPIGSTADLTARELRDLAVWQTTVYVPLGPFSFAEAVLLAPELNLSELIEDPEAEPPSAADTAAGARFQGRIGAWQIEAGYLYRGADGTHNPFVSLHGDLFFGVYLAASAELPQQGVAVAELPYKLLASGGIYHILRLAGGTDLAVRLEALLRPGGRWEPGKPGAEYGLLFYPELVWNVGPKLSLVARSFVSPVDLSALSVLGADWKLQTGLRLLAYAFVQLGEDGDTYGWGRPGDLAFSGGFRYVY